MNELVGSCLDRRHDGLPALKYLKENKRVLKFRQSDLGTVLSRNVSINFKHSDGLFKIFNQADCSK